MALLRMGSGRLCRGVGGCISTVSGRCQSLCSELLFGRVKGTAENVGCDEMLE